MWWLDGITDSMDMCCMLSCSVMPTLCNPMDCSPPGSSVHGDSLVKNSAVSCMPSTRGSSQPRDRIQVSHCRQILYQLSYYGSPQWAWTWENSETVRHREPWHAAVHGVAKSWIQLGNWITIIVHYIYVPHLLNCTTSVGGTNCTTSVVCWWAWVASMSWLLEIVLLWILESMCLFKLMIFIFPDIYPGGELLSKEPGCQCRRPKRCRFSPWVGKIPWRIEW